MKRHKVQSSHSWFLALPDFGLVHFVDATFEPCEGVTGCATANVTFGFRILPKEAMTVGVWKRAIKEAEASGKQDRRRISGRWLSGVYEEMRALALPIGRLLEFKKTNDFGVDAGLFGGKAGR